MGRYTDAFKKYKSERHQRSMHVAKHKAALKDDTQPKSPSRPPTDVQVSPVPKAFARASMQNGPATQTHSSPAKKQRLKTSATVARRTPPSPAIKSRQPSEKSAVQKDVPRANSHNIDPNLISIIDPYSLETDLFKTLRGKILFPVSGKPPKSLMVTSAVPGEGKTFIASNLAVNLAQNIAEYVLLLDCDLRRPRMHKMLGFNQVKGLSDHLSNGTGLSDLLLKTVVDKLTLLPAGTPPLNPSEILSSAKMANLIDEVKTRYDDRYLIIDSPPPLLAPETSAIAKRVDGIIVVIKYGETSLKIVEQMIESLGKEKIIGAVLNRIDSYTSGYYGYTKYRKYYQTQQS